MRRLLLVFAVMALMAAMVAVMAAPAFAAASDHANCVGGRLASGGNEFFGPPTGGKFIASAAQESPGTVGYLATTPGSCGG